MAGRSLKILRHGSKRENFAPGPTFSSRRLWLDVNMAHQYVIASTLILLTFICIACDSKPKHMQLLIKEIRKMCVMMNYTRRYIERLTLGRECSCFINFKSCLHYRTTVRRQKRIGRKMNGKCHDNLNHC